jgi:gamma-glutamyl:cysteine ligase YbdK (ATP-grasp superfamily)
MKDLVHKRKVLAKSCEGLILPLGSLITDCSRSRTSAWHIHIGGLKDLRRAYAGLVYYLPLLTLLGANAPYAEGRYFGQSFRMHYSFAVGPLTHDWSYRFQDIIYSRRLKTIEIRIFDPIWDLERIRLLLGLIRQIVLRQEKLPLDRKSYNELRHVVITAGYDRYLSSVYQRLRQFTDVSEDIFRDTCSHRIRTLYERHGLLGTYTALDNAYRSGRLQPRSYASKKDARFLKIIWGFLTYYIPKLPFSIYKAMRER